MHTVLLEDFSPQFLTAKSLHMLQLCYRYSGHFQGKKQVYTEEYWADKFIRKPEGAQKQQSFLTNSLCLNVTLGPLFCAWLRTTVTQEPLSCTASGSALIQKMYKMWIAMPIFTFVYPPYLTVKIWHLFHLVFYFRKSESSLDRGISYTQKVNVSIIFNLVKWELQDKYIGVKYFKLISCSSV